MPDYSRTIIYKLINYDYPDLVYVGSTTNFTNRKRHHKSNCYNEKNKSHNLKVYISIRENGGWDNWNMIKICDYPCNNKREAEKEEDKYMMEFKANMNSIRAFLTEEERKEKEKQYREDNKETIKEKKNEYMKDYMKNNKERKQEYDKKYREDNKENITKKLKEKITCKCGCVVTILHLKRHERTKKHIDLMNK